MAREKILVVEDDEDILELVTYNLIKGGFIVSGTSCGDEALNMVREDPPDLVVLDVMLPKRSGFEICQHLKSENNAKDVSIIMLTAKDQEKDILEGLEMGADDYITKPFSPKVLVARIKAVLRRASSEENTDLKEALVFGDMVIHAGKQEVVIKGQKQPLTYMEFQILHFLACHPGWVYTRRQIVSAVRGDDYAVTDRSVDVLMVGLRKKLGSCGNFIETVRGVGYRFKDAE